jgi:hypothetical protein
VIPAANKIVSKVIFPTAANGGHLRDPLSSFLRIRRELASRESGKPSLNHSPSPTTSTAAVGERQHASANRFRLSDASRNLSG